MAECLSNQARQGLEERLLRFQANKDQLFAGSPFNVSAETAQLPDLHTDAVNTARAHVHGSWNVPRPVGFGRAGLVRLGAGGLVSGAVVIIDMFADVAIVIGTLDDMRKAAKGAEKILIPPQ